MVTYLKEGKVVVGNKNLHDSIQRSREKETDVEDRYVYDGKHTHTQIQSNLHTYTCTLTYIIVTAYCRSNCNEN